MARQRFYSLVNLLGLAVGLACLILAMAYFRFEKSYDRWQHQEENIYRIVGSLKLDDQGENPSSCVFGMGPAIRRDYPHFIQHSVRFFNFQDPQHTLSAGETKGNEEGLFLVDSTVFRVFDFRLKEGDTATALNEPNCIVIDADLAHKYFGDDSPLGKILRFDGSVDLKVTGVLEPPGGPSHMHYKGFISFSTVKNMLGPNYEKNWVWNPCWTYVRLHDGVTPAEVNALFPELVQKYYPDHLKKQVSHELQPLRDIHLHSHLDFEMEANGDAQSLYIFLGIGLFVLFIAIINFVNLSTARSAGRLKEIGIRKSVGAGRGNLLFQFMVEALLTSLMAMVLAIGLVEIGLPGFNQLTRVKMDLGYLVRASDVFLLVAISLGTGLIAGFFPAWVMSGFQPQALLKGAGKKRTQARQLLVGFQFALTGILLVCTGMVQKQLNHLQEASLGFHKERVVMLPVRPPMAQSFLPFIDALKGESSVAGVTVMNDVLGKKHNNHEYNFKDMPKGEWVYYPTLLVDEDFVPTLGIDMVAGRNFLPNLPREDSFSILINESMAAQMGWTPQEAIGQRFNSLFGSEKVVGVMKDFHFVSLMEPVKPFVLDMAHEKQRVYWIRYITVRLGPGDLQAQLSLLEKTWNKYSSAFPFTYFFLDNELAQQYASQERQGRLVGVFSGIAIFIACLGLFALAAFTAEQKTKEIGVRKVMGASALKITAMLTKRYLLLVTVAIIVSFPIGWLVVRRWQEAFADKAPFDPFIFVYSLLLSMGIAFVTVFFQSMKAARRNPVRSLRYE